MFCLVTICMFFVCYIYVCYMYFYIKSLMHVFNFIISTILRIFSAGYFTGGEELTDLSHLLGKSMK